MSSCSSSKYGEKEDTHKMLFTMLIFVYYNYFTIGSITTSVIIFSIGLLHESVH